MAHLMEIVAGQVLYVGDMVQEVKAASSRPTPELQAGTPAAPFPPDAQAAGWRTARNPERDRRFAGTRGRRASLRVTGRGRCLWGL